jgi:hypothetical protein
MIKPGGGPPGVKRMGFAGVVSVFSPDGHLVGRQHVRAAHDFNFLLLPGRYLINAGTQMRYKWPFGCKPVRVRVRPRHTTNADVFVSCGIP